ncbi:hypothetical protein COY27_00370 [Candidatus Woesearchaeota archaeon CG_4_10_14_0_2_um_filter_33_13]|nr:MAG: hypothetical protein COY27_00370 [Candidatus Woesearchaeota archaeon CG_4_10_14_0_2_um_filter_33_13]
MKLIINLSLSLILILTIFISGCNNNNSTKDQAISLAEKSECGQAAYLTEEINHNEYTNTWWINLKMKEPKTGCNPACVINLEQKTAEINWRCTGLLLD